MKYTLTAIFSLILFFEVLAHTATNHTATNPVGPSNPSPYLFEDFHRAIILYKSGTTKKGLFNYNLVKEEMVFRQAGALLMLDLNGIDTVYLGGKKFVPFGKTFCEVQELAAGLLYIRHRLQIKDQQSAVGYGGFSETTAATAQGGTRLLGDYYDLEARPKYEIRILTVMWIKRDGLYEVSNSRQLQRAFPEKKMEVRQLVKEMKTDFNKPNEVIQLLSQLE